MINKDNIVDGFISLNDYPNICGVDPTDWEVWIRNMFQKFYMSRNTLFIHCACCKDSVIEYFLEEALVSVFENDTYLLQIILLVTSDCNVDELLQNQIFKQRRMSKHQTRRDDDSNIRTHCMYVACRDDYCPKFRIRSAVEEDNDDIVEILDKTSPRLTDTYGNFYISEIIGRQCDDKRKIIVAESHERAVGVMCLNRDINYRHLQNIYELKTWYGLKKATPLEKEQHSRMNVLLGIFGEPIMRGEWSPISEPPKFDIILDKGVKQGTVKPKSKNQLEERENVGRVIFKEEHNSEDLEQEIQYHGSNEFSEISSLASNASRQSVEMLLEEDPFDYEIVNIDEKLLIIPTELSNADLTAQTAHTDKNKVRLDNDLEPLPTLRINFPRQSLSHKQKHDQQLYSGEPNAFSIELFGLREDIDPRRAFDLLEVAFEVMKEFDYCIIRVPSSDKSFPLLEHFCYVPVKPRICCSYSLYIAHRSSVLGKLRVRAIEVADIPAISQLLQAVQSKDTICTIENNIKYNNGGRGYVFMCGLSVIGLGILEVPDHLDFLRSRYSLEHYHIHKYHMPELDCGCGFSAIKTMIVYPAFEAHYRYFARELMRMSGNFSLIWMTTYRNKWLAYKANSIASAMIPLVPRKAIIEVAPVPELKIIAAREKMIPPFGTWFLDKKLTSVPLVTVSTRIVVIGASRTAMSFINALIFDQSNTYLCFTGVTLISPNGLPYLKHNNPAVDVMFQRCHNMSDKYLKIVPYSYYVNVIQGTMCHINRQDKYIKLSNGGKCYYDILILALGKQYQHPDYLKPAMDEETTLQQDCSAYVRLDIPRKRIVPKLLKYNTPENVFFINDLNDANKALRYVKTTYAYDQCSIYLVYGARIDAYCCLTGLLEVGIPAKNIVFVEPFPSEDRFKTRISPFNNSYVDGTVNEVIKNLGIKVYRSYFFKSWNLIEDTVTEVEFLSMFHLIKLKCAVLFYYGKRGVDTKAYLAINECGMGYDGGILIDHKFCTKDPCIYAVGPCTAYYRRYFAMDKKHKYFDSTEVGEKLGFQIRNQYDPLFTVKPKTRKSSVRFSTQISRDSNTYDKPERERTNKSSIFIEPEKAIDKIPNFTVPKSSYFKLPGGLQFLEVISPGKKIPHPYVHVLDYSGIVLETFKNGYFKLHLNDDHVVDSITCLTFEKYNLDVFRHIYGHSSAVLNNVHLKHVTKKVDNFYDFFRSPWAYFLYHDQCDELFAMAKELLPLEEPDGDTVAEALHKIRTSISYMTTRDSTVKNEIKKRFDATPHIQAISDYVIEWLEENDVTMTMYLQPSLKGDFLINLEKNLAFQKKRSSLVDLISATVL